jgi:hypothetical protein
MPHWKSTSRLVRTRPLSDRLGEADPDLELRLVIAKPLGVDDEQPLDGILLCTGADDALLADNGSAVEADEPVVGFPQRSPDTAADRGAQVDS